MKHARRRPLTVFATGAMPSARLAIRLPRLTHGGHQLAQLRLPIMIPVTAPYPMETPTLGLQKLSPGTFARPRRRHGMVGRSVAFDSREISPVLTDHDVDTIPTGTTPGTNIESCGLKEFNYLGLEDLAERQQILGRSEPLVQPIKFVLNRQVLQFLQA